jgi:hypothetical protein
MSPAKRAGPAVLAGTAWGGLVLGHLLTYLLTDPAATVREAHLAASGHGSFHLLVLSALAAVPVALVLVTVRALAPGTVFPLAPTARLLLALQAVGFVLLELAERGLSPSAALADPAVRVGLLIQVLVAFGSALLLGLFTRAVRLVAARLRRPSSRRPPVLMPPRPVAAWVDRLVLLVRARKRAPPLPLGP